MAKITITVPDGYLATAVYGERNPDGGKLWEDHATADPKQMTNDALLHVFEYGFQRFVNDKVGGKDKDRAEKTRIVNATIERLTAETYVRRATRESNGDPLAPFVRSFLRATLQRNKSGESYLAFKATPQDDRNEFLDDLFAKQDEATQAEIRAEAELERERHEAELARKRQQADKIARINSLKI